MKLSKLEKLYKYYQKRLPDPNRGHLSYDTRKNMHEYQQQGINAKEYEKRSQAVEEQLQLLNLDPLIINILMDKIVSDLSLQEIQIKYKFRNRYQVHYFIEKLLKTLKKNTGLKLALKRLNQLEEIPSV